jgi:nitrate reductase gamma subunit
MQSDLPTGPGAIAGMILIVGFIGLLVYQAVRQGSTFVVPTRDFIAFFIVMAFVATVAYMFVGKPNEGADILVGALIAAFSAIVAMYFRGGKSE